MCLPKLGKIEPQIRPLEVLSLLMILFVGIHQLGGTPIILGLWEREITMPIMGLPIVLGPVPKMIPAIRMDGGMRLERQLHVNCAVLINSKSFVRKRVPPALRIPMGRQGGELRRF